MAEGTRGEQGQRYGKRAKQKLASFTVTALASYFVPPSYTLRWLTTVETKTKTISRENAHQSKRSQYTCARVVNEV